MREQILAMMMKNPQAYFSGEEMAKQLGITRAAVWKHIDALKKLGCTFDSKPNRGYRLLSVPDVLAPEILSTYDFTGITQRCKFKVVESTTSTNDLGKQLAAKGAEDGLVVLAEEQTHGRGRMARTWVGEKGQTLMFSLVLRPPIRPTDAAKIPLIAGLALSRAVEQQTGLDARVKWPNDVLIGNRKLCGVLTEMTAEWDRVEFIVCGIGINVNQRAFPKEIENIATSLYLQTGQEQARGHLLLAFLTEFFMYYDMWVKRGDFTKIVTAYTKRSMLLGEEVVIDLYGKKMAGTCIGFDRDGCLVIERDGKRKRIVAGDISVRSAKTYV